MINWKNIYGELSIEQIDTSLLKKSRPAREAMLLESREWPRGNLPDFSSDVPSVQKNVKQQIHTIIYHSDGYEIGFFAPGKEASNKSTTKSYVGDRGPQPNFNDMLPIITKNGQRVDEVDLTFGQMFDLLGRCAKLSESGLLILAAMLYRNGFCLDHKTSEGKTRLVIPEYSFSIMQSKLEFIGDFPIKTFIYFMDLLALNEDTKVHALGRDKFERYGRTNTLLTFTHVIGVILGLVPLAKLCGSFSRPPSGMAPITDKDARSAIFTKIKEKI